MDWDTLLPMLGSGGLVGLLNWLFTLRTRLRQNRLDKEELSRIMQAKDNQTILELYDKNRDILARLAGLEEMLFKLVRCRHYATCPARHKLQQYKESYRRPRNRQSPLEQKGVRYARSDTRKEAGFPSADVGPP